MKTGVVILSHGSKLPTAQESFRKIQEMLSSGNSWRIEFASLQFSPPTFSEAVAKLAAEGFRRILIVPLFLFPGQHVQEDLPNLLSRERETYKKVDFFLSHPLGPDPRIVQILKERIEEALTNKNLFLEEPSAIEEKSMAIVENFLYESSFSVSQREVVKKIIHATGDPTLAPAVIFSEGAIESGLNGIKEGRNIISDVHMVKAGIDEKVLKRFGGKVNCFIRDAVVKREARKNGKTRAATGVARALLADPRSIVAIGNAPTALFKVCQLVEERRVKPRLVVGVPVGFVGASEVKKQLKTISVPFITVEGTKGGSSVAVAIINTLLKMAEGKCCG